MAPYRSRIHHGPTSSSGRHHSPATDVTPSDILSMARTDSTFPSVYGRSQSPITTTYRDLSYLFLPGCQISRPSLYRLSLRSLRSAGVMAYHRYPPSLLGLCPLPRRLPTLRRKHGLTPADSYNVSSSTREHPIGAIFAIITAIAGLVIQCAIKILAFAGKRKCFRLCPKDAGMSDRYIAWSRGCAPRIRCTAHVQYRVEFSLKHGHRIVQNVVELFVRDGSS